MQVEATPIAPSTLSASTGLPPGAYDILTVLDPHVVNAVQAIGLALIVCLIWVFVEYVNKQAKRF